MNAKRSFLFAAVASAALAFTSCSAQETNGASTPASQQEASVAKNVDATTFNHLVESGNGVVLDVRTAGEFRQGHIENCTQLDIYQRDAFQAGLEKLDKNTPVYVYCRSGNRSGQAMNMMKQMGFKEVYNLQGGIGAYQAKGFKVVR